MIAAAFIFIILGAIVKYGKMYFLLAGYNTMPKEEKAKYDIDRMATLFRNVMFGMALIIFIGFAVSEWFGNTQFQAYSFYGAMILGIPYLLVKSNSKQFKKEV